jgi:hypothetical protein
MANIDATLEQEILNLPQRRDRPVNALYRGDRFAGYAADAA